MPKTFPYISKINFLQQKSLPCSLDWKLNLNFPKWLSDRCLFYTAPTPCIYNLGNNKKNIITNKTCSIPGPLRKTSSSLLRLPIYLPKYKVNNNFCFCLLLLKTQKLLVFRITSKNSHKNIQETPPFQDSDWPHFPCIWTIKWIQWICVYFLG